MVKDAAIFPSLVDARRVPGDTLLIDFMYFIHPVRTGGKKTNQLSFYFAPFSIVPGMDFFDNTLKTSTHTNNINYIF